MNFKTYLAILEDEGLQESPLADGLLVQAMDVQKQINAYENYRGNEPIDNETKRLEELKIKYIWEAIDLARANPPDSDMHKLTMRAFRRANKREYKGFLNEYKLMQQQSIVGNKVINLTNLTPAEQRVNDRWNEAIEKQKRRMQDD